MTCQIYVSMDENYSLWFRHQNFMFFLLNCVLVAGVVEFMELVMAGLAGSSHMIACTLLALRTLLFHFRGMNSCFLLQSLMFAMKLEIMLII